MSWPVAKRSSPRHDRDPSRWLRDIYRRSCSLRSLPPVMVGLFTVAYFAVTCSLASLKPFSFDELTTYNIARLPTVGDVWRAWIESGDGMPPLVHLATHLTGSALGFSHVTGRLPPMMGFWLMCLGIFIFLRRRVCPMLALIGMLLPVTVPLAYSYAYEARGYGMVLGFSAAAVVCWDLAHDTRWRRVALLGLPVSLAGAVAAHVYAVLVVVPLALAELARTLERRRMDWPMWLGFVAAGLVFVPANPVVSHIRGLPELARYVGGRRLSVSALMEVWSQFLSISATYLGLLALVCLGRDRTSAADDSPCLTTREGWLRTSDWALVIGLMALPLIGWLFASLVTGLLPPRYVIVAVIGFSLAIPLLCRVAVTRRPEIALLLAGWVVVSAAMSTMSTMHAMRTTTLTTAHIAAGRGCFALLNLGGKLSGDGLPIVVSDFYVFNQIHHYGPEPLRRRLVFLVDRESGGLIHPHMAYYARVFGQRMEWFEEFLRSNPSFYLYDCGSPNRLPLVARLVAAGASLHDSGLAKAPGILLPRDLYRVSQVGGSPGSTIRR